MLYELNATFFLVLYVGKLLAIGQSGSASKRMSE